MFDLCGNQSVGPHQQNTQRTLTEKCFPLGKTNYLDSPKLLAENRLISANSAGTRRTIPILYLNFQ